MLFPEEKTTYETTRGGIKFIVTSEAMPGTRQDMFDALSRLMVRDCGEVFDPTIKTPPQPTLTPEDAKRLRNFKTAYTVIWNGLEKKD